MLSLIPRVKTWQETGGFLNKSAICYDKDLYEPRLVRALERLPFDGAGARLDIVLTGTEGEAYTLRVDTEMIRIEAPGPAGAFYAIQTLRQLFAGGAVPCVYIQDAPDFACRGWYQDVTRGKVPTLETVKQLIDRMAYYKLNSLQLYVEHTFAFAECRELNAATGYFTAEEIREIDRYCRENFIECIPSIATFGHMYEILQQERYRHLRVRQDSEENPNVWRSRMMHHTIDPLNPESFALVASLIDQYHPLFTTNTFNICCDETFDLKQHPGADDTATLYVTFVKKLIAHLQKQNKQVMMWADILLQHPETIETLPADICFLNWDYAADPSEENVRRFADLGQKQIVCPGTWSWSRLCENVAVEEANITRMAEYGYRHGAQGMLNTNWGDWGNPCSLELAMYGLVLGAEKSWSVATAVDDTFYAAVNTRLYGSENGMACLKALSDLHEAVPWERFCQQYFDYRFGGAVPGAIPAVETVQAAYQALVHTLSQTAWADDAFRQEMCLAAEGICVMAELTAQMAKQPVARVTDTYAWLARYRRMWMAKNKESELSKIDELFRYCEEQSACR